MRQSFTAANGIGIAQDLISHQRTESTVTATPTPRSPDVQQSSKKPSSQQQQHNHKQQHFLHHSLDLETVSEEVHHHPPPPPVDAALLYREIRDSLTPLEFDKFADSVAAFNAGRASAEDSIYAISLIIKDSYLFSQMKRLISDAILEDQKRQVVESTNSGSLSLPTAPHPTAAAEAKEF